MTVLAGVLPMQCDPDAMDSQLARLTNRHATKVYIAGPYSAYPEKALAAGKLMWHALKKCRLVPFLPHLTSVLEEQQALEYQEWIEWDLEWLACCEVLIRCPGPSPGADCEVEVAKQCRLEVIDDFDVLKFWLQCRGVTEHIELVRDAWVAWENACPTWPL